MRCQAGDLALVIAGHDRSLGQMVTCIRLMHPGEPATIGGFEMSLPVASPACWLVDPPVQWRLQIETDSGITEYHASAPYCADCCLMPVRPKRDEDLERVTALSDAGFVGVDTREIHVTKGSQV